MRDEIGKLQKELSQLQRKIVECNRQEAEIKRRENESKLREDKLRAESDMILNTISSERSQLEIARKEQTEVFDQLRRSKEELSKVHQYIASGSADVEVARSLVDQLNYQRNSLTEEIERLRLIAKEESHRNERIEGICQTSEERLKQIRADIHKAEEKYDNIRISAENEALKCTEHQKLYRQTDTELKGLEMAVERAKSELERERKTAISDLGMLSQAKMNVQHQILTVTEAQRRANRQQQLNHSTTTPVSIDTEKLYSSQTKLSDSFSPQPPHTNHSYLKSEVVHSNYNNSSFVNASDSFDTSSLLFEMEKLREKSEEVLKSVGIQSSSNN